MSNPLTFDYSKVPVINRKHVLNLPKRAFPTNPMDELRVRNFEPFSPGPRQIPNVDQIEQERLRKYGQMVDVDPEAIAERLAKMTIMVPIFGPDGQPYKDQTGRVVKRYMTFPQMISGSDAGGEGLWPALWHLGGLLGLPDGAIMRMPAPRIDRLIKKRDKTGGREWEIISIVDSISSHIKPISSASTLMSGISIQVSPEPKSDEIIEEVTSPQPETNEQRERRLALRIEELHKREEEERKQREEEEMRRRERSPPINIEARFDEMERMRREAERKRQEQETEAKILADEVKKRQEDLDREL
ncbi:MAG: hypothetical protein GY786_06690, partial [Proteobacteria bacterium]|nr:hypothetical protein [Pseudomonadota bacterium]